MGTSCSELTDIKKGENHHHLVKHLHKSCLYSALLHTLELSTPRAQITLYCQQVIYELAPARSIEQLTDR